LARKLEYYELEERVKFDDSALQELKNLSGGNSQHVSFYAGLAILSALQSKSPTITGEDIKKVDIFEAIKLMTQKNFWSYLPRQLNRWDTERISEVDSSIREGRLPKYALTDRIKLAYGMLKRAEIYIPFKYNPYPEEVKTVAHQFANFVSAYTGKREVVQNVSTTDEIFFQVYHCLLFRGVAGFERPENSVVIVDDALSPRYMPVPGRMPRKEPENPRQRVFQSYVLSH